MGVFDDSFSIELKSPIDKASWEILEDVELDNTEHIFFTTPSGKRVDFIKADALEKISAEIEEIETYDGLYIDRAYVLQIIDKYKAESEEE